MGLGINRAIGNEISQLLFSSREIKKSSPCIFLSHRSLDKPMVRLIADYISNAGIDYYLDEEDTELQQADEEKNDKKTVDCIQRGIKGCSHILCILSEATVSSWWVPYEIGYGECLGRNIASLKIKNLPESKIPAYLRIRNCMMLLNELNEYLIKVNSPYGNLGFGKIRNITDYSSYKQINDGDIVLSAYNSEHPLFTIIDN